MSIPTPLSLSLLPSLPLRLPPPDPTSQCRLNPSVRAPEPCPLTSRNPVFVPRSPLRGRAEAPSLPPSREFTGGARGLCERALSRLSGVAAGPRAPPPPQSRDTSPLFPEPPFLSSSPCLEHLPGAPFSEQRPIRAPDRPGAFDPIWDSGPGWVGCRRALSMHKVGRGGGGVARNSPPALAVAPSPQGGGAWEAARATHMYVTYVAWAREKRCAVAPATLPRWACVPPTPATSPGGGGLVPEKGKSGRGRKLYVCVAHGSWLIATRPEQEKRPLSMAWPMPRRTCAATRVPLDLRFAVDYYRCLVLEAKLRVLHGAT